MSGAHLTLSSFDLRAKHVEVLPLSVCVPSLVVIAQVLFLLECGHTPRQTISQMALIPYPRIGNSNKKHLKNVVPIRHCEPPHAACFTLPFTRCHYCRRRLRIDVHNNINNNNA